MGNALARYRVSSPAIAGATGRARGRKQMHSTRSSEANQNEVAPLFYGHRSVVYFAGNHGDGGGGTAMKSETVAKLRATGKRGKWLDGLASSPRRRWR